MPAHGEVFSVKTQGKGTYDVTGDVERVVDASGIGTGTATVVARHTSCSLVIYENADPSAREDLHRFFEHFVPDDLPFYAHTYEGSDDTTSHLRMALTRTSEVIPVIDGRLQLGTWQGVYLFEHRGRGGLW